MKGQIYNAGTLLAPKIIRGDKKTVPATSKPPSLRNSPPQQKIGGKNEKREER